MTESSPLHKHVAACNAMLQGALVALQFSLRETQEENITQCMNFFWTEIERYYEAISSFSAFSCRQGCSFCCFDNPHGVTGIELKRIVPLIGEEQRQKIQRLKKQYDDLKTQTDQERQVEWKKSCTPCPLLRNNQCSVYSVRPLACRSFFSVHPEQWCHPLHPSYQEQPQIGNDHIHELMDAISRKEGLVGTTDLLSGLSMLMEEL